MDSQLEAWIFVFPERQGIDRNVGVFWTFWVRLSSLSCTFLQKIDPSFEVI